MKKRLLLLSALLVLLGLYLGLKNSEELNRRPTSQKAFREFSADRVSKIEITNKGKKTILERQGENFLVTSNGSFAADKNAIADIINNIKNLNLDELVSTNVNNHDVFEVNEKGINLKTGGHEVEFWIGRMGPDFQSTYVRRGREALTYLTRKNIASVFSKSDYRDLTILKIETNEVTSLTLDYGIQKIKLEKEGGKWLNTVNKKELKEEVVDSVLRKLADLKGTDVFKEESAREAVFSSPYLKLTIKSQDKETELTVGNKNEEGHYFTKTNLNKNVYLLPSYAAESLPREAEKMER